MLFTLSFTVSVSNFPSEKWKQNNGKFTKCVKLMYHDVIMAEWMLFHSFRVIFRFANLKWYHEGCWLKKKKEGEERENSFKKLGSDFILSPNDNDRHKGLYAKEIFDYLYSLIIYSKVIFFCQRIVKET